MILAIINFSFKKKFSYNILKIFYLFFKFEIRFI